MDRVTMEYSLDQNVIYEHLGGEFTGKIVGQSGDYFIILLDQPLPDRTKAVLVPSAICRPLTCHWCRDTQRVAVTPFTLEQYNTNTIPMKECPYCTEAKSEVKSS